MAKTSKNAAAPKERAVRMAPDERRRQLTECAVRVFARMGIGNSYHSQVAAEAGVSVPTVYLYMPNRQALIDAVLSEVEGFWIHSVSQAANSKSAAADKILAVVLAYADTYDSDPDQIKIFLNWSTSLHHSTWPQYEKFQDQILTKFEKVIRVGIKKGEISDKVNPVWGAHLVMGSAHMIAQMKMRSRDPQDIDAFIRTLVQSALLRG